MAKKKRERYTPADVVAALKATEGRIFQAADKLGCSHQTVRNYAEKYPEVAEAVARHKGKRDDYAEGQLWKAVKKGEAWAVCFYLKTQCKDRGYTEKSIVEQEGEQAVRIVEVVRARSDGTDGRGGAEPRAGGIPQQ